MANKQLLSKAISVVGILLAAFGSVLVKVQPPGEGPQQIAGLVGSFSALAILLLISGLASLLKKGPIKFIWTILGLAGLCGFIIMTFTYGSSKNRYIIGLPPNSATHYHIVGDVLSDSGKAFKERLKQQGYPTDNANLVFNSGGPGYIKIIWSEDAVNRVTDLLVRQYTLLMIFLSVAIFSITEGVFYKQKDG